MQAHLSPINFQFRTSRDLPLKKSHVQPTASNHVAQFPPPIKLNHLKPTLGSPGNANQTLNTIAPQQPPNTANSHCVPHVNITIKNTNIHVPEHNSNPLKTRMMLKSLAQLI